MIPAVADRAKTRIRARLQIGTCVAALSLALACTRGQENAGPLPDMGGGIVRVFPSELHVPSRARVARVEVRFVAPSGTTLFVSRCGTSDLDISLQWRREGQWVPVPNQFCSYVLGPPAVISPDRPVTDTLSIAIDPSAGDGEYRMVAAIYTAWRAERGGDPSAALPEALRVSNSFRVVRE